MNRHKLEVFVIIFFFLDILYMGYFQTLKIIGYFNFFFVLNILKIDLGRQNISSLN